MTGRDDEMMRSGSSGEKLRRRASKELEKRPDLTALIEKPIDKYDSRSGQYKVNRSISAAFFKSKRFKEDFFSKAKVVFACGRKDRHFPFDGLSPLQKKIILTVLRSRGNFRWCHVIDKRRLPNKRFRKQRGTGKGIDISKRCSLTLKELRTQVAKIYGYLDCYIQNTAKPKVIDWEILMKKADKIQANGRWKYCQVEITLPPITSTSKWHSNQRVLQFLGIADDSIKKMSAESLWRSERNKTVLKLQRRRKSDVKRVLPLLRRHGIRAKILSFTPDYGESLIRASL